MVFFGPQGNSDVFCGQGGRSARQAMEGIISLGVTAYEYTYGRGFPVGEATLDKIGAQARKRGPRKSCEGWCFISLGNSDGFRELHYYDAFLRVAAGNGAERLDFQPGSAGEVTKAEAFAQAKKNLSTAAEHIRTSGAGLTILRPPIADERHDIGALAEIIEPGAVDESAFPGMALGHPQVITDSSLKDEADGPAALDEVRRGCGEDKYRHTSIYFSRVRYAAAGGREHQISADPAWGPFMELLADLIAEQDLSSWCIGFSRCTQAEDAVNMQKMHERTLSETQK